MRSDRQRSPTTAQAKAAIKPFAAADREPGPSCCGKAMEPPLAKSLDRDRQGLFVTVWRCPICGRSVT